MSIDQSSDPSIRSDGGVPREDLLRRFHEWQESDHGGYCHLIELAHEMAEALAGSSSLLGRTPIANIADADIPYRVGTNNPPPPDGVTGPPTNTWPTQTVGQELQSYVLKHGDRCLQCGRSVQKVEGSALLGPELRAVQQLVQQWREVANFEDREASDALKANRVGPSNLSYHTACARRSCYRVCAEALEEALALLSLRQPKDR